MLKTLKDYIYIYILQRNIQRLEVQFTRTSNTRKWGGRYLISCYPGGICD